MLINVLCERNGFARETMSRGVSLGQGALHLLDGSGAVDVTFVGTGPGTAEMRDGANVASVQVSGAHIQLVHASVATPTATILPNVDVAHVTTPGSSCTLTLPSAATAGRHIYIVKDMGCITKGHAGHDIIVQPASGTTCTIDGAATAVMNVAKQSLHLACDGTDWFLV